MTTTTGEDEKTLRCYRCGADLSRLTLPLSRMDLCPECSVELHVCRMCACFSPGAAHGCTEDDAEEVHEKARANFCDYFKPSPDAYDGSMDRAEEQARDDLAALFGEAKQTTGDSNEPDANDEARAALERANALFDR